MLKKLVIPENTKFEEGTIIVENDVIIGTNCALGYGIIGRKIVLGEKTSIEGDLIGEDIRLDAWCSVRGNVISKGDAYLADFTTIGGKLTVYGDLEIGRNVKIKNGFEAKGLITIQSPLPVLIFVFVYLLELLRLGRLEEAEKLFEELDEIITPLNIPDNSILNLEVIRTSNDIDIEGSRVLGNLKGNNISIEGSEVFGSLRGSAIIVDNCRIHGEIEGDNVYIINRSEVFGRIKGSKVHLEEKCSIEGALVAKEGVIIKPKIEISKGDILEEDILDNEEDIESNLKELEKIRDKSPTSTEKDNKAKKSKKEKISDEKEDIVLKNKKEKQKKEVGEQEAEIEVEKGTDSKPEGKRDEKILTEIGNENEKEAIRKDTQ